VIISISQTLFDSFQIVIFFDLKIQKTIIEFGYAPPLAVNSVMSCDLRFCPKLE